MSSLLPQSLEKELEFEEVINNAFFKLSKIMFNEYLTRSNKKDAIRIIKKVDRLIDEQDYVKTFFTDCDILNELTCFIYAAPGETLESLSSSIKVNLSLSGKKPSTKSKKLY